MEEFFKKRFEQWESPPPPGGFERLRGLLPKPWYQRWPFRLGLASLLLLLTWYCQPWQALKPASEHGGAKQGLQTDGTGQALPPERQQTPADGALLGSDAQGSGAGMASSEAGNLPIGPGNSGPGASKLPGAGPPVSSPTASGPRKTGQGAMSNSGNDLSASDLLPEEGVETTSDSKAITEAATGIEEAPFEASASDAE